MPRLWHHDLVSGLRRVLIPEMYDFSLDVALAPDGRTLAVRAQLEPLAAGAPPRLYRLDLEDPQAVAAPWLGSFQAYRFRWAPQGLTLIMHGTPAGPAQDGLFTATPQDTEARRVMTPGADFESYQTE